MQNPIHTCPAPDCDKDVPFNQLACREHWYQIPKDIRDRVWSAYRAGPHSPRHLQALADAVASLQP